MLELIEKLLSDKELLDNIDSELIENVIRELKKESKN